VISPSDVTGIVVTRGNVDLLPTVESLAPLGELLIWDNSHEQNLSVYGRYAAIERASFDVILVQDDDCLIDPAALCAAYEPGVLVANMPASRWPDFPDSCLVGWGAIFDRDLVARCDARYQDWRLANAHYRGWWPTGHEFHRTCDVMFATLTPHRKIDVGFTHLPWAEGPDRMFTADPAAHRRERQRMLELARKVRDG
jgi:hypothetical protein